MNDYLTYLGWFADFESPPIPASSNEGNINPNRVLLLNSYSPPIYVLESNLSDQHLWYETAGKRPEQPPGEREYFENIWNDNLKLSEVTYTSNESMSTSSVCSEKKAIDPPLVEDIIFRGDAPFSNAVSKLFTNCTVSTMGIQIPRFSLRRNGKTGVTHAEFLVVISLDNRTFGVWKRHSEFKTLAKKVSLLVAFLL